MESSSISTFSKSLFGERRRCILKIYYRPLQVSYPTSARVYIHADEWGMLCTFLQPAFLYRIIARLALHPCRVTHMPYRPVKKLRRAIDDPELCRLKNISFHRTDSTQQLVSVMLYETLFIFPPFLFPTKITNAFVRC